MSLDFITTVFTKILDIYKAQGTIMLVLCVLFTALSLAESQASSPGKVWWRNPGLFTDISYALIHAVIGQFFKLPALLVMVLLLRGVMTPAAVDDYFKNGHGPLADWPDRKSVV